VCAACRVAMARAGEEEALLGQGPAAAEVEAPAPRVPGIGRRFGLVVVGTGLVAVGALARTYGGAITSLGAHADLHGLQSKAEKATPKVNAKAPELEKARQKLGIEVDLSELVSPETLGRDSDAAAPSDASACSRKASKLFDRVTEWSGLSKELQQKELAAFKDRFVNVLKEECGSTSRDWDSGDLASEEAWLKKAGNALDEQKPVMTHALAESLNAQGFGFDVQMQDWMVDESKSLFHSRLGRSAELPADANVTKFTTTRSLRTIPATFNSSERWPHCSQEIMRIHNQGHCGSCWAFSCSQVLDARLCIQSHHLFDGDDASLAPGYFASCAANGGFPGDGCQGGWEYYCYDFIDRPETVGGVSETCNPYFASGAGVEHFTQTGEAPECPTACQDGYERSLEEEGFKLPGVGSYLLVVGPDQAAHIKAKETIYNGGSINYGIFAHGPFFGYSDGVYDLCNEYSANHAVVAYGYFPGGYYSKNSWGETWGNKGLFMVADCIVTDFTAPGDYERSTAHIPYPLYHLEQR